MDDVTGMQLIEENAAKTMAFDLKTHLEERKAQIESNIRQGVDHVADMYDPIDAICDKLITSLQSVKQSSALLRAEERKLIEQHGTQQLAQLEAATAKLQSMASIINGADEHARQVALLLTERMHAVAAGD